MEIKNNKKSIALLFLGIFLLSGFFIVPWYAKRYLKNFLEQKIPSTVTLNYTDLNVNLFKRSIVLDSVSVNIRSKKATEFHSVLYFEALHLRGIDYYDLLFTDRLSLGELSFVNPDLAYYPDLRLPVEKDHSNNDSKAIHIGEIIMSNGSLKVLNNKEDATVAIGSLNLNIINFNGTEHPFKELPFNLKDVKISAQKVYFKNTDFEKFAIDSLTLNKNKIVFRNFKIIPEYDKVELSKHLETERDYVKLSIPKITIDAIGLQLQENKIGCSAELVEIIKPNLEIYRDKLVPDDQSVKSLYSKSLRNLAFDLEISQTKIKDGYISYTERVDTDSNAGKLYFEKVSATLDNISNRKETKKTEIKINSTFMGAASLELNWSFDVNNETDAVFVSGAVMNLPATVLDPFLKRNMNVLTEGTLKQMYFTFEGDRIASKGGMKMKYGDFKVKILRKNSSKVNQILTAVGSLFIKKGSDGNKDHGFRYGDIEAERDATKSFFNYLWINVQSGLVSVLTGDGEKD
ncbi:hypothetical protein [Flavobacterium sp. 7A]|uniref:hypothetical protein n=1 Tax=Flavobacterium sp. 7A TaxID=2940571 RepID=UPI002225DD90|nr:hypothetical protein [Flavobacterium sp. 7A]MCW2119992.1 hypothetical protein [Flavobacterium sp. 7A]